MLSEFIWGILFIGLIVFMFYWDNKKKNSSKNNGRENPREKTNEEHKQDALKHRGNHGPL